MPKAKEAAARALAIDPGLAEAHISLGWASFTYAWDWPAATSHFEQARALNAAAVDTHPSYQFYLTVAGRSDEAIRVEYDGLFGGVGKPEVYLFGSHYLSGFLNEKPLARLRTDLAELGLARDEAMPDTEDHVAYLCEVMRYLIAGDDVAIANLTRQREFFTTHMQPWIALMCETIAAHPKARFYAALSAFNRAFINVETQGFDMLD